MASRLGHRVVDAFVEAHGVLAPEQRARLERKVRRHLGASLAKTARRDGLG